MTKTVQDEYGNEIFAEKNNLYLRLKDDNRKRCVGRLDLGSRTLSIKRDRSRHLHYKSNSYGFNYLIIKNGTKFDTVLITDEKDSFLVPKEDIIEKGRFLYFKQQGFEKQIFMSLEELSEYKSIKIF